MIEFLDNCHSKPFQLLKKYYSESIKSNQIIPEAISISSYDSKNNFVDSRYVNLKFIKENKFIFFSNYKSTKAQQFEDCSERLITALIFWNSINIQIRIRGKISKTSKELSDSHFKKRSLEKNALAIASKQSRKIESYEVFVEKYKKILKNSELSTRPDYWGGYEINPVYIEFWEGNDARINRRQVFELVNNEWKEYYLQP